MRWSVLITGGAGFIGSHAADALLQRGCAVRVLDNLAPQVHGSDALRPDYLHSDIELHVGDVRDRTAVRKALADIDAVVHLAAAVGVGQSMYEIAQYTSANNLGTAVLLEEIAALPRPLQRLVVASSMSIYGEGLYRTPDGQICLHVQRSMQQLRQGLWEPHIETNGGVLEPLPTPEDKPPQLSSVYALSKFDQERLCLLVGRVHGIPTVALRLFNVYGPRQALSNPYTGVLAIFATRLLNDKPPIIYEDGGQQRDFVSVHDVALAVCLALERPRVADLAINIGSGVAHSVLAVAQKMAHVLGKQHLRPEVKGRYRAGDIRHCFADITRAEELLGYTPRVRFDDGIMALAEWIREQSAVDRVEHAYHELEKRGLAL